MGEQKRSLGSSPIMYFIGSANGWANLSPRSHGFATLIFTHFEQY